jgi:hypothetical protein
MLRFFPRESKVTEDVPRCCIPSPGCTLAGCVTRALLIDLAQGRRIEVEALQGSVVRRAAAAGLPAPIMSTLYAVLKPFAAGAPPPA